jgi:hypothetical protein
VNVICSVCSKPLPKSEAVGLNARWSHTGCFSAALKGQTLSPAKILRALNEERGRKARGAT